MIYSTATVPVNPDGVIPLSRAQVWQGLVLKARDARLFLPPGYCTKCDVTVEGDGFIVREATILNDDLVEGITFEPENKVSFHQWSGPREGVIINEIQEDAAGDLQLKFYCFTGLRNAAAGGAEEQAEQAMMDSPDKGYRQALLATLDRTRALVVEGRIL